MVFSRIIYHCEIKFLYFISKGITNEAVMGNKTAVIIGATGLIGRQLVKDLLSSDVYSQLNILTRKSTGFEDYRIKEFQVDFDKLDELENCFEAEDVFCCIGTTIKKAGSKEEFIKVDYQYPIQIGKIVKKTDKHEKFLVVTAVGANPNSSIFYNRVKGEVERDLKEIGLPSLHIFQPSLLLGERDEFRFGELIGKKISAFLSFFLIGSEKKPWAIDSSSVARAMFLVAQRKGDGAFSYDPYKIRKIGAN